MIVQTDYTGIPQIGLPPIGALAKKPSIAPAKTAERQQEDQRQQQNSLASQPEAKPLFKTLLSEVTLAGLSEAKSNTADNDVAPETAQFVRPEKTPDSQTAPTIANADATFAYLAASKRNAAQAQTQTEAAQVTPLPQDFVTATSRYAELAVAASNVLAGRGETLELQA